MQDSIHYSNRISICQLFNLWHACIKLANDCINLFQALSVLPLRLPLAKPITQHPKIKIAPTSIKYFIIAYCILRI